MKYVVILGDGMADYPIEELGMRTPLQYANIPNIDFLARNGELGLVKTIPDGIAPASDTANLSVMGYDPNIYYSGRSPLEAVSMGVALSATDVTFRCNLVTLSDEKDYFNKTMIDHSCDEIPTDEAKELITFLSKHLENDFIKLFPGISYRHLIVWDKGPYEFNLTPPHDILERKISSYLPKGEYSNILLDLMVKSAELLKSHPINLSRIKKGLKPANSIWIWGEGKKPALANFFDKYGLTGSVISAVDLIKGIGICAGLNSVDIDGATGTINTNFIGKANAALTQLKSGKDFVYIHVEAPDECGHRNEVLNKVKSIEFIDEQVVKIIREELDKMNEDYKIMVLPDHPTPLSLRTHTSDPVPFLIYQSNKKLNLNKQVYDEICAKETGLYFDIGHTLMDYFLKSEV